jgi:hypothetical protein
MITQYLKARKIEVKFINTPEFLSKIYDLLESDNFFPEFIKLIN